MSVDLAELYSTEDPDYILFVAEIVQVAADQIRADADEMKRSAG